jgi:hypothetical protein
MAKIKQTLRRVFRIGEGIGDGSGDGQFSYWV